MGVTDTLAAFYLDRAVFTFGRALEAELDKAGAPGKGKQKRTDSQIQMAKMAVLNKWLGINRFADPAKRG